jgi:hypothetical protein
LKTARRRAYFLKTVSVQNALYNIINHKAIQEQTTMKDKGKQREREGNAREREGDKGALREEEESWRRLRR